MNALSELLKEKEDILAKILAVRTAERHKETDMLIAGLTFVLVGVQHAINNLSANKQQPGISFEVNP